MAHHAWNPPSPIPVEITTDRLCIPPYVSDDADALFAAIEADRASYLPWLPWVRVDNRTVGECHYNIERFRRDATTPIATEYTYGVFRLDDGGLIGGVGFRPKDPGLHVAEVGYWVRPDGRGRGYCTEFTGHMISWLFRGQADGGWGLRRVDILMAADNVASQRIPQKLNMRLELAAVQERYVDDVGYHDTRGYGILAAEWDHDRHRARDDRAPGMLEPAD